MIGQVLGGRYWGTGAGGEGPGLARAHADDATGAARRTTGDGEGNGESGCSPRPRGDAHDVLFPRTDFGHKLRKPSKTPVQYAPPPMIRIVKIPGQTGTNPASLPHSAHRHPDPCANDCRSTSDDTGEYTGWVRGIGQGHAHFAQNLGHVHIHAPCILK